MFVITISKQWLRGNLMKLNKIMTSIGASLILTASLGVNAHDVESDHCDVNVDGNLVFENQTLTITLKNGDKAVFTPDGDVIVDGVTLDLDSRAYQQAQNYYHSVQDSVPVTIEVAKEAVAIANTAVVEVFGQLLGEEDELTHEFDSFFADVNYEIDNKFYTEDGAFYMDTASFNEGQWNDSEWEHEFEEKVESLVAKSIGRLLVSLGTEMLFNDGDTSDFETRMENFGESLEERLTVRGEELEIKAEQLCTLLAQADIAENALAEDVAELAELNVFNVNINSSQM